MPRSHTHKVNEMGIEQDGTIWTATWNEGKALLGFVGVLGAFLFNKVQSLPWQWERGKAGMMGVLVFSWLPSRGLMARRVCFLQIPVDETIRKLESPAYYWHAWSLFCQVTGLATKTIRGQRALRDTIPSAD